MKKGLAVLLTIAGVGFADIALAADSSDVKLAGEAAAVNDCPCKDKRADLKKAKDALYQELNFCDQNPTVCKNNSEIHEKLSTDVQNFFASRKALHDCIVKIHKAATEQSKDTDNRLKERLAKFDMPFEQNDKNK